jgi:UDP-N-acetylmuramate dehydrogenase
MNFDQNIPLNNKNWFRTGGPARFYCEPQTIDDFKEALTFAREKSLPLFVLGKGANILVSDDGFDGLVIRPQLKKIRIIPGDELQGTEKTEEDIFIEAQAGVSINELIEFCLNNNAVGLEKFSCIPGTVGGSVFINIHYFEFYLSDFIISGTVANKETGKCESVPASWFKFGYDDSTLRRNTDYLLLSSTFKLKKSTDNEVAFARGRRAEIIRHRMKRYPATHTCGCFFRNFHKDELKNTISGKNTILSVAHYLDRAGLKGELACGNARVSYQHANMIVTEKNATSSDIVACARAMQESVYKSVGVIPQPECQLVGFKEYPLLKAQN